MWPKEVVIVKPGDNLLFSFLSIICPRYSSGHSCWSLPIKKYRLLSLISSIDLLCSVNNGLDIQTWRRYIADASKDAANIPYATDGSIKPVQQAMQYGLDKFRTNKARNLSHTYGPSSPYTKKTVDAIYCPAAREITELIIDKA